MASLTVRVGQIAAVTPPSNPGPYFGWSLNPTVGNAAMTADVGPPNYCRTYSSGTTPPASWAASSAGGDDALGVKLSHWSYHPPATTFGTGTPTTNSDNILFQNFLNTIPAQRPNRMYVLTCNHEPRSEWKSGAFTPQQWRDTQVRAGQMCQAMGRSDIKYAMVTEGSFIFSAAGLAQGYDPDVDYWDSRMDTAVDYIFHDNYIQLAKTGSGVSYEQTTDAAFSLCEAYNAKHNNRPMGCSEFAINEETSSGPPGHTKAGELAEAGARAIANGYIGIAYFDSSAGAHYKTDPTYALNSSAAATAAWKAVELTSA